VLGAVGATVGGLVWGTAGYVVGYTAASVKEELDFAEKSKSVSVEIDVEESSGSEGYHEDELTERYIFTDI